MLRKTDFGPVFLDNCINSKFLVAEIMDEQIVGACFVGGILNSNGIEIAKSHRGKRLGTKLLNELFDYCNKQNIPFLTGVFKPSNAISIHAHMKIGYIPLFAVYYNEEEGMEIVVILPFNKKGKLLTKLLRIFNTKIGNFFFVLSFKILSPFFKQLIAFDEKNMPKMEFGKSIQKFQKVEKLIDLK